LPLNFEVKNSGVTIPINEETKESIEDPEV
jgi:hypothetical protein